jgi:cytochrome c biogenesis protein CcmG, thiol:disulfide interchange protein DsbE
MNRKVLLIGLIAAAPLVALLVAGLSRDPRFIASPLVGRAAPPFRLTPVGGGAPVTLASLKGQPVVLNFWATWCVECVREHDVLASAAQQLAGRAAFLGAIYQDSETSVLQALNQRPAAYPILMDEGGRAAIAYGVYGVPETFFISADGVIVDKQTGPLSADRFAELFAKADGSATGGQR